MPRIPPSLFHKAISTRGVNLALLLPATRSITSAQAELGWIKEHVENRYFIMNNDGARASARGALARKSHLQSRLLRNLCRRRGKGEPLQYVLGSQPFWPLEILCKPGVLIPRQETEASIHYLAQRLRLLYSNGNSNNDARHPIKNNDGQFRQTEEKQQHSPPLRILDLCTGTGCIPLLLAHLLSSHPSLSSTALPLRRPTPPPFTVIAHGIDVSPLAISLARQNLQHNQSLLPRSSQQRVSFALGDIFSSELPVQPPSSSLSSSSSSSSLLPWDIITANPPYISPLDYLSRKTTRSVRNWEPRLALVPSASSSSSGSSHSSCEQQEDVFYARILDMASRQLLLLPPPKPQRPQVLFFEVGDLSQATRVVQLVLNHDGWNDKNNSHGPIVEIWRDAPDVGPEEGGKRSVTVQGREIPIHGTGEGRSVFIIRCGY